MNAEKRQVLHVTLQKGTTVLVSPGELKKVTSLVTS